MWELKYGTAKSTTIRYEVIPRGTSINEAKIKALVSNIMRRLLSAGSPRYVK